MGALLFAAIVILLPGCWAMFAGSATELVLAARARARRRTEVASLCVRLSTSLAIALALAALSWPVVALSLHVVDTSGPVWSDTPSLPGGDQARWVGTGIAALASAVVAGSVGAYAVELRRTSGAVFTFLVALAVGVAAFPLGPALLGRQVGVGILCFDGCVALVGSGSLESGVRAEIVLGWSVLAEPVTVALVATGVALWTSLSGPGRSASNAERPERQRACFGRAFPPSDSSRSSIVDRSA